MDNFNTHGGYFAPQGYTKVNEGGSHEENPNGGVQIGVDQNGVPNLLEEGEPVFKDFVFSDNIKADAKFLEQFGIPKKYADKLYSQIADAYIDEAETRPYDQISANGLNAMLGRLAEAQEAQKAAEEEAALMEELKNMSPEEIAAIQEALAQEAMPQEQVMPEEQIQPEVMPEMVAPEQTMLEAPMMACGGKMNKYDGGGRKGHPVRKALDTFFNGPEGLNKMKVWVTPGKGSLLKNVPGDIARIGKKAKAFQVNPEAAYDAAYATASGAKKVGKLVGSTIGLAGLGAGLGWAIDAFSNPDIPDGPTEYEYDPNDFALGGKTNRFDWGSFMDTLNNYKVSTNRGGIDGRYKIDTNFPLNGYKNIAELENSDNYRAFTDFVLANPTNENVLNYLKTLDAGTNKNAPKLFDENGALRSGWDKLYSDRRTDKLGGIYHFSPDDFSDWTTAEQPQTIPDVKGLYVGSGMLMPFDLVQKANSIKIPMSIDNVDEHSVNTTSENGKPDNSGFDIRLLSPLVDAAMGLANLATPADHYDFVPIRPYLPSGRIRQQYERYNPIDQNMVTNQMLAQANANMRALRNAGLGPSTGANLLVADYNAGLNLGNALANVWGANNQRRNQVIAQNNQADAAIANYDWNVELARANALNQFAPYNQRMALQTQMLNNQAEQDKYNAVAASINSGKKFLNDYGWELMNRNMLDTNRGMLGYFLDRMNRVKYDPNRNKTEESDKSNKTLLKKYKKEGK